jgi:hypothetical protein
MHDNLRRAQHGADSIFDYQVVLMRDTAISSVGFTHPAKPSSAAMDHALNSSSSDLASIRSLVSKPSVNQL